MTRRQDAEAAAGGLTVRILRQSDILRCPHVIIAVDHYREDGSCKCDDPAERRRLISTGGYHRTDFDGIPLRKPTRIINRKGGR